MTVKSVAKYINSARKGGHRHEQGMGDSQNEPEAAPATVAAMTESYTLLSPLATVLVSCIA